MLTTVDSTPATIQERSALATRELVQVLDLGMVKTSDLKFLTLALAEVARETAAYDKEFAARVRTLYQSYLPGKAAKQPKSTTQKATAKASGRASRKSSQAGDGQLVPIGTVDEKLLDPYAPPNPWALQELYGDHQLQAALNRYSAIELKKALPLVQQRFPGTKPESLTKTGIVAYIVEQLTHGGSREAV